MEYDTLDFCVAQFAIIFISSGKKENCETDDAIWMKDKCELLLEISSSHNIIYIW
jgi:hypothetical protein